MQRSWLCVWGSTHIVRMPLDELNVNAGLGRIALQEGAVMKAFPFFHSSMLSEV